MKTYLKGGLIYVDGIIEENKGVLVDDNGVVYIQEHCPDEGDSAIFEDVSGCVILPSFTDVHVHLREPGLSYKETVETGTKAAKKGGYACVLSMPNVKPSPSDEAGLKAQLDIIGKDACVEVHPYAAITVNSEGNALTDFKKLKDMGAVAFSDDGRGVQSESMMEKAMVEAKKIDAIIAAHCEDNSLLNGGYIHDGEYCKIHGHKGICSESEWGPIKRDLELAEKTGVKYHVCHISTKESVEIIRQAKKEGLDITCETGPHYLILNDMDICEHGRFKMNPPIRSEEDRKALIEGVIDGTIDMIATDHAPHSEEEKTRGLEKSLMGVVGIEHAFSLMYTHMVKTGIITLEKLTELLTKNPCERFGLDYGIELSKKADLCVFDLSKEYEIRQADMLSKGKFSPFIGDKVYGECLLTMCNGKIVYQKN
jgi:dihydroorotase